MTLLTRESWVWGGRDVFAVEVAEFPAIIQYGVLLELRRPRATRPRVRYALYEVSFHATRGSGPRAYQDWVPDLRPEERRLMDQGWASGAGAALAETLAARLEIEPPLTEPMFVALVEAAARFK